MALVGEKPASDAMLDKILCVCSGRRPIKAYTEGLADLCSSRDMVPAQSSMDFSQELLPLFFEDTSLKDSGSTFLVEFSFMNLVGFRTTNNASSLILVFGELLPIKVG